MSCKEPAAGPACSTQKPQARESPKSSFKKNGRDVALKCCTVVSYLRKRVKDSAQLPQGRSPVIKYIWFQSTCKKTTFKSLLYLVASAQLQLHAAHQKGQRRRQLVNSPLDFVFLSSIWVCIQLNPSQSHLPVTFSHNHVYLVKQVERTQVHPCIWVCRTSIPYGEIGLHLCELLPASSETPFGLKFHRTERFFPLIPFFACDFPDARLDMPLTKKLAEFGAQKKGRFCA